jgi:polysaccharide export outer membrane protein
MYGLEIASLVWFLGRMAVMRTGFLYKSLAAAVLLALGIAITASAAQTGKTPPPELVQYIRETKRQGFADAKIKSQAVAVGWPPATVDEAFTYLHSSETPAAPVVQAAAPVVQAERSAAEPVAPAASPAPKQLPTAARESTNQKQTTAGQELSANRGAPDDYVIGSGDTLQITVWNHPEVSVPVAVVRPDGKITVPLVKELEVLGLTPVQAEQKITEGLTKYYEDPNVAVVVATINSKKLYVSGAARKEGPLAYTYGMTVMQALSEAGGLNDYAKRKRIYILRQDNGQTYRLDFNYDNVVKGQNMEQNIVLLPGDTIVIPH